MIDRAQLAQRGEECQQEAQIIHRDDEEILMKYGHDLCYKVFNKLRFSSSWYNSPFQSNYPKKPIMRLSVYFEMDDASLVTSL